MPGDLTALEDAVLADSPPGAVIAGASISPDGRHGVALAILPTASSYPMDERYELVDGRWEGASGGSGCGTTWSSLDECGEIGVLRYGGEAPADASAAWVAYAGEEHRVPVRHRHFLFVAWNTPYSEEPRILRFE